MSKQGKRKITVELPKSKDLSNRPSVFERLGTKKSSGKKTTEHCRQWAQHGSCAFGKSCKFAATHILISPSKQRAANKDNEQKKVKDDGKNRLHSTVVVRSGRSPDGEIDNWDQNDLEYADTDVLEKRRQQLQRELEIQLKMDSSKDMRKDKKKTVSSSSSSRSSSSSSVTSSSSDGSSSSSSSGREARRKGKKGKLKRNSSSSSEGDVPSKKKFIKGDSLKRDKSEVKKGNIKKDDKSLKKNDPKKKVLSKSALGKKSLSPGKKSGGTPPITSKSIIKNASKHAKSPVRRDKKSISPHSSKDRTKERDKEREKEREKEKERLRGRSRSPRKARSRSPRPHGSNPKDPRSKGSIEPKSSRPVSPKKQVRKDEKKKSVSRDRAHNKERSLERRKDKHDDKDTRHDRKDRVGDRGRDRTKDTKRDDSKRRGRERGLGRGGADKGLEKPNKPMERLLPRPEERLAALAAISNRNLDQDKNSTNSKDRQDSHSERGGRKQDRERDRSSKRDRIDSMDRDPADYEMGMDRQYDHGHGVDHYERGDDRYDDRPGGEDRSPVYGMQGRDRHYDAGYDMAGPPRGYPEEEDRIYGYDERRRRDHSWEGRSGSMERERGYMHPHKEWDNEDYRAGGDWGRDRHWPMHDPQRGEWGDKEPEMEGWHHRGPGPHRGRPHGKNEYNRGMRMDTRNEANKRRPARVETEPAAKETPPPAAAPAPAGPTKEPDTEDPIPDDLSEISDDPDDILNREDMAEHHADEDRQLASTTEESAPKAEGSENQSTQDTSAAMDEKDTHESKDEEDAANMDFEEISDGELEEERTRAGLGDALGVDWASLVADVRRREQPPPSGGARDRWRPERVLARLGVSLHMAGEDTVRAILDKAEPSEDEPKVDVDGLHPVAAIQVATQKRKRQRAVLFGSGCEITRALSARRDLALRRHLCRLPAVERAPPARPAPLPHLFQAARALLLQG